MQHLIGENGYNEVLEVRWDNKWLQAKIIPPPKSKLDKADRKRNIFIHFNGWNKTFDQWFPLDTSLIRACAKGKLVFSFCLIKNKLQEKYKILK